MGITIGATKSGTGCLILFALPFAGVGLFMACLMASGERSSRSRRSRI